MNPPRKPVWQVPAFNLSHRAKKCASCGAAVYWIETAGGKRMPLDVGTAEVIDRVTRECISHFAVCPHARAWKRPAERRPAAAREPALPKAPALTCDYCGRHAPAGTETCPGCQANFP